MAKNIIICGDGTGMEFGPEPTNVARLLTLLDGGDPDSPGAQVRAYFPGVGTLPAPGALTAISRGFTLLSGLAVGFGLLGTVAEMYRFLIDHYEPGDRIYLFGFSRGAFTVRALAGLLHRCGLLLPGNTHLVPYALTLYQPHLEKLDEIKRDRKNKEIQGFRRAFARRNELRVEFLGIWDTVKSFGYFWPKSMPHTRHNTSIKTVRHAIALDERRSFYAPTTWGGVGSDSLPNCKDIKEVWFAGSHSDVGGGYENGQTHLADISLRWMIDEARNCGLLVDDARLREELSRELTPTAQQTINSARDPRVLHESQTLGWKLTEVFPRLELVNYPLPPRRKLKLLPSGQRDPKNFQRNNKVRVHISVRQLQDYELRINQDIVEWEPPIVGDDTGLSV